MRMSKHKRLCRLLDALSRRQLLNWVPDGLYLKLFYQFRTGKKLNLKNPQTFNEKLQWLKIYDRKPEYTTMVDKYLAKDYVASIIGKEHIIPTLGVWDKFDDINFDELPHQFVLKCTHDSGGLVIVTDKTKLDRNAAKNKIEKSLRRNFYWGTREWPYKNVKPRIIAEKYIENESAKEYGTDVSKKELIDYKFYCFHGEPRFFYISKGLENHKTASISFVTNEWKFAPFRRSDYKPFDVLPPKPERLEQMLEMARQLSRNHIFLRVDLYEVNSQLYFSELTFTPSGGVMTFEPDDWYLKLGT